MKIIKGCTYWYEISMFLDFKGDGHCKSEKIRIPVGCEKAGEYVSTCIFLNPSSAMMEKRDIENRLLFDSPIKPDIPKFPEDRIEKGETGYSQCKGKRKFL